MGKLYRACVITRIMQVMPMKGGSENKIRDYGKILAMGVVIGLCNGLFGAGGGIIAVSSMVYLLGLSEHDAHATAISVILPLAAISAFIYFRNGHLDLSILAPVALGEIIGAVGGAWLLKYTSSVLLRKIFALFIIFAALRMIF